MDKAKRCRFEGRKQGCVGWRVAWRGEGMETTVLEQRFKKKLLFMRMAIKEASLLFYYS